MNILLVDDEPDSRTSIGDFLTELGHQVTECASAQEALTFFAQQRYPMVLSDINMPGMSGLDLLERLQELAPPGTVDIVLFTGYGDMSSAITALRAGAYDYLLKPVQVEELAAVVERIAERQALLQENRKLTEQFQAEVEAATAEARQEVQRIKASVAGQLGLPEIGVFSPVMAEMLEMAYRYHSDRSMPVLIQGETGTGKEIVARCIHFGQAVSTAPFVAINCAALTPTLFESELFGYEGGAFTGGSAKGHKGKLDLAAGGTLFLDEVNEIPLDLQGKLLRVIQEREFYRVGGVKKQHTDVRLICATNVDLAQAVANKQFRQDLYYRLRVGYLQVPPLRERRSEIVPLARLFLREFACSKQKQFQEIAPTAARLLEAYDWPGNVRELRNSMEWIVFMYDDSVVKPEHLQHLGRQTKRAGLTAVADGGLGSDWQAPVLPPPTGDTVLPLDEYVDTLIQQALVLNGGNKAATARYLGISRRSLYCRLESRQGRQNDKFCPS